MTGTPMETACPFCGKRHDRASDTRNLGVPPVDGDITLCFYCGEFCTFDNTANGGLRKPTKKEQRKLASSDLAQDALKAWKIAMRQ